MFDRDTIPESIIEQLKPEKRAVLVDVEDHVMESRFLLYFGIQKVCEVSHVGGNGDVMHLESYLKAQSKSKMTISKKQRESEGNVDHVYDIPFELGKLIVGYRHDQA